MSDTPTQSMFELVLARPAVSEGGDHPHLVHLWWRAPQQGDRVVQVYVNDELVAVTLDPAQRETWLTLDHTRDHRIELLGVDAGDPDAIATPRPDLLTSWQPHVTDRAAFTLIRDERLPVDTQIRVSLDGTVIDRAPLWPAREHRGGFGALFGVGEFGRDAVTGPGLGTPGSELGMGPLGADGTAFRWSRGEIPPGAHTLEIAAVDETGQAAAPPVTSQSIEVDALPTPPRNLSISSDFTLTWNP
jgi:hypothetical protein